MDTPPEPDADPELGRARRERLAHANDGLIAAAGVVEGVAGAGAPPDVVLVAGLAALLVGVVAVAGVRFMEVSDEHAARDALVEAEARRIAQDPDAELAELALLYEAKGLSSATARVVAEELSARDALAAQLDAEYGLGRRTVEAPWRAAASAGGAFVVGGVVPILAASLVPPSVRIVGTFLAVAVALGISATIAARSERMPVLHAVLRTVGIGVGTMVVTLALGSLLDFSQADVDVDLDL